MNNLDKPGESYPKTGCPTLLRANILIKNFNLSLELKPNQTFNPFTQTHQHAAILSIIKHHELLMWT